MRKPVTVVLRSDRVARIGEEVFTLPAKTVLSGELALDPSDGPMGTRESANPGFLNVSFDFDFAGRRMRYSGTVNHFHLWAPDGTQTTFEDPAFVSECGVIDGVMDNRKDWSYIRPDGVRHTNRLKYTSCHFELMLRTTGVQIRCRYYDQNSDIADYVTIHYTRDLDNLVLLKDTKYYYDQNGDVEDWSPEEGPYVTLTSPSNGGPS